MHYFKNVELTKLYPVSEAAVRKWIDAARQGKTELQLFEHNGKLHIANTAKNLRVIETLVAKGKKYKNTRGHKTVEPKRSFYDLFTEKQIFDIISSLEVYHELPLQYSYFDGGVEYWDSYAQRLWQEEGDNMLNASISLIESNMGNIDGLLEGYEKVNVIDVGVGNALPVKELLTHLIYDQAIFGRYIGLDISTEMLKVAERNLKQWFGDNIAFEGHLRDISYQRFDDLLLNEDPHKTVNIVLMLGGTINNFRSQNDVLRTICNSMGVNDLLLTTIKLDSYEAQRYFDFTTETANQPRLAKNHQILLELLNIDESFYEVEQMYDAAQRARFIRVKLMVDLTINFSFGSHERVVELHKGDSILLWRYWHQTAMEMISQFNRSNFALVQASTTRNRHYLLTMTEIDRDSQLGP